MDKYIELVTADIDGRRYALGVRESGRRDYLASSFGGGLRRRDLLRADIVEALEDALEESREAGVVRYVEIDGERLRVYRLPLRKGEVLSVVVRDIGRSAVGPHTFMVYALTPGGGLYPVAQAATPEDALDHAADFTIGHVALDFRARGRI